MKLAFTDRHAQWSVTNGFNILPALQIRISKSEPPNLNQSHGLQKRIEIDIHFSFLFLWAYFDVVFIWLDKQE